MLNFFSASLIALNFTILFHSNDSDYFHFDGKDSEAHLYNDNSTIKLYTEIAGSVKEYESTAGNDTFEFRWPYYVDGVAMNQTDNNSINNEYDFDSYTFFSPFQLEESTVQCLCEECCDDVIKYTIMFILLFTYIAWIIIVTAKKVCYRTE